MIANFQDLEAATRPHVIASQEANRWRGRSIDRFARAEQRLSQLLILASSLPAYRNEKQLLPKLVGQKFARLLELQNKPGPLQNDHLKARLEQMAEFHPLRGLLCHGEMTVALLESGDWQIGLETLCCEDGKPVVRSLSLTRERAELLADRLDRCVNDLGSAMGQVRKALDPNAIPAAVQPVALPV